MVCLWPAYQARLVLTCALFCQALCHSCDAVLMWSTWSIFCLNFFFFFLKRTVVCIQLLLPWLLSVLDAAMLCARLRRWGTALLSTPLLLASGSAAPERTTAEVCTSFPKSHPDISHKQATKTCCSTSRVEQQMALFPQVLLGKCWGLLRKWRRWPRKIYL